jgi:heme-degrading monooxygenase HmoA
VGRISGNLGDMVVVLIELEKRKDLDQAAYRAAADRMHALLEGFPGLLSVQDFPAPDGAEINLVRFESLEALQAWRDHPVHREVQQQGRELFYERYRVEVLTPVRAYSFERGRGRVEE